MTVKELIEQLNKLSSDAQVHLEVYSDTVGFVYATNVHCIEEYNSSNCVVIEADNQ